MAKTPPIPPTPPTPANRSEVERTAFEVSKEAATAIRNKLVARLQQFVNAEPEFIIDPYFEFVADTDMLMKDIQAIRKEADPEGVYDLQID